MSRIEYISTCTPVILLIDWCTSNRRRYNYDKKDEDVQLMELYKKTMDNVNMSPYKKMK